MVEGDVSEVAGLYPVVCWGCATERERERPRAVETQSPLVTADAGFSHRTKRGGGCRRAREEAGRVVVPEKSMAAAPQRASARARCRLRTMLSRRRRRKPRFTSGDRLAEDARRRGEHAQCGVGRLQLGVQVRPARPSTARALPRGCCVAVAGRARARANIFNGNNVPLHAVCGNCVPPALCSNATTLHESVDESSTGSDNILGDVFREFGRVLLYRDLPPWLRGPSQFENLPDEVALVSIFGRLDSVALCCYACVCSQPRRWSDTNRLWMRLCQQRWGVDIIKRAGKDVSTGGWKLYFRERSLAHRAEVATTPLSLERLRMVDEENEMKQKIKVDISRPVRSQLEAACVYMPKSNQDVRTMEMAQFAPVNTESEARPPQKQQGKTPGSGKKTRRGRRGRGAKVEAAAKADGLATGNSPGLTVRQSSAAEVAAIDTNSTGCPHGRPDLARGLAAGMFGSRGGSGAFGANPHRMAPSPPLEPSRRPPSPRGSIGGRRTPSEGSDSNSPWSTRGHELKPATPPAHLQGRSKQPTPPPSTSSGRRRDLNLRAFGSHEAPPPFLEAACRRGFDDMPMSRYAGGFVTPTRGRNVEDDATSSDEEDEDEVVQ